MINTNFCVPQYFNFSITQPLHKMFISSELIHTINWDLQVLYIRNRLLEQNLGFYY